MESILTLYYADKYLQYALFAYAKLERIQKGEVEINEGERSIKPAFKTVLRLLGDISGIKAIGHLVTSSNPVFFDSLIVSKDNFQALENISEQRAGSIMGVKAALEYLPDITSIAVCGALWFKNLPSISAYYSHPNYFYGISHQYAAEKAAEEIKTSLKKLNLITVNFEHECTIAAVEKGKAVDASTSISMIKELGNNEAHNAFVYQIRKQIGGFASVLPKLDALVFSGSDGKYVDDVMKKEIINGINKVLRDARVLTIETHVEDIIARETKRLIESGSL